MDSKFFPGTGVAVAIIFLSLPTSGDFTGVDLSVDLSAALAKVEH